MVKKSAPKKAPKKSSKRRKPPCKIPPRNKDKGNKKATGRPPRGKGAYNKFSVEETKQALTETGGFLTYAAQMLGCSHTTIQEYVKNSEELQEHIKSIQEQYKDLSETILVKKLRKGAARKDAADIDSSELETAKWYLKHKGRDRGYFEKHQIAGDKDKPLHIKFDYGDEGNEDGEDKS